MKAFILKQGDDGVPLDKSLQPEHHADRAILTSGLPDFSTRRLMQGFGLSVY